LGRMATVSLQNLSGFDSEEQPLSATFAVDVSDYGASSGRRLMASWSPLGAQNSPFQSEVRIQPVCFPYPYQDSQEITLHLPDGYGIEQLPDVAPRETPDWKYKAILNGKDRVVRAQRTFVLNKYKVYSYDYHQMRAFFQTVRTNDDMQLVLRPIETAAK
jgi:hypothetical protein